jgi:hypothetical protein
MSDWIIQFCSTIGCDVVIRERLGKQDAVPVCKWCMNSTSHAMNGHPNIDPKLAARRVPVSR